MLACLQAVGAQPSATVCVCVCACACVQPALLSLQCRVLCACCNAVCPCMLRSLQQHLCVAFRAGLPQFLQCMRRPPWCCKPDPVLPPAWHFSIPQMRLCTAEALARTHAHQGLHTGSKKVFKLGGPCCAYPARRAAQGKRHPVRRGARRRAPREGWQVPDRLEADGGTCAAVVTADAQVVHQLVQARRVREVQVAHLGRVGLV